MGGGLLSGLYNNIQLYDHASIQVCVVDHSAPKLEECQYGDTKDTFTVSGVLMTCSEWMKTGANCYTESNRLLCCETCRKFHTPDNIGCEYGDPYTSVKISGVVTSCEAYIQDNPSGCTRQSLYNICCGSCFKLG